MSGHSKWATIKHKKAATDAKRGKIFTKIIRELTIAARTGGADPITNPRLRTAILSAKGENMPNDNIERAIQRGTGTLEGETLDEVTFEGYGPGGVGVLVQVVTNNRNRIVSEVRHMFSKNGGNMAENGAVGWMFHRKGDIIVAKEAADEDKMLGIVLDAGAEDMRDDGAAWEVVTPPEAFEKVREALIAAGITPAIRGSGVRAAELREAGGRASAADGAHDGNAGRSRRRAARLRQLRHRRKGTAGGRRLVGIALLCREGRVISGAHVIIYSQDAEADRAFFREVLGFACVDAGHGWLIFALPPTESAFHPSDQNGHHELYFLCDDLTAEMAALAKKNVACAAVHEERWGSITKVRLPGGGEVGLYQPKHRTALGLAGK